MLLIFDAGLLNTYVLIMISDDLPDNMFSNNFK